MAIFIVSYQYHIVYIINFLCVTMNKNKELEIVMECKHSFKLTKRIMTIESIDGFFIATPILSAEVTIFNTFRNFKSCFPVVITYFYEQSILMREPFMFIS